MSGSKLNVSQIIAGLVVGVIIGGFGAYFSLYKEIAELKIKVNMQNFGSQNGNNQNANNGGIATGNANSVNVPNLPLDKIIDIIKEQQTIFVKESYGENANQCFTDIDLQKFMAKEVPNTIRNNLQKSNEYLAIVIALKNMDPVKRQQLLSNAQNTFKPTWGEMGRISREGQTDAGQSAEKLIAASIVDLTKNLMSKTKEELVSMMQ
jgi:hypothetical protein